MASIDVPESLVDFLVSGVGTLVATVDRSNHPEALRAGGTVVSASRDRLRVLLPAGTGARTRANLASGSGIAITYCRPIDYRTLQVKGSCLAVHEPWDADRAIAAAYHAAFIEALYVVGMTRAVVRRVAFELGWAIEVAVDAIFQQTPGPTAGAPFSLGAAR